MCPDVAVPASCADGGFRDGFPVDAGRWATGAATVLTLTRCRRGAREAQPWLARAFFLRFASFRFRFTDGFS
jgi:hypothetical protein